MKKLYIKQIEAILDEDDILAALCNVTAFLNEIINDINWVGFYFYKNNELILGPFQGRVACTHLSLDKGVCAHSFNLKKPIRVDDVHAFSSHIACDSRTNSELVTPLIVEDRCIGVLDIDSISFSRFNKDDEEFFVAISNIISKYIKEKSAES